MQRTDMNSITLYHHPLSVCSMKVRLALEEKGVAWSGRIIDIVKTQEQLEPWYLELNPRKDGDDLIQPTDMLRISGQVNACGLWRGNL